MNDAEDDIPLGQYLYEFNKQQQQLKRFNHTEFKPLIIPQDSLQRRPSYPSTPSALLDTYSDDEDDEDLVPIAVLQSPQRTQFQSAAEKYKEKVKAQLLKSNKATQEEDDDDEIPLSCFYQMP